MKVGIVIAVIAVVVGMIVTPFAFLFTTPAGILTPVIDDTMGGTAVIAQAVETVNGELEKRISKAKRGYRYTELDLQLNNIDNWRDVFSVYAVQQTTASNPQSAMLFSDAEIEEFVEIYNDTHPIRAELEVIYPTTTTTATTTTRRSTSTTATRTTTRTITTTLTTVGTTLTSTTATTTTKRTTTTTVPPRRVLHITVRGLSVDEMSRIYGFDAEQRELLTVLLSPEFEEMWEKLLAGIVMDVGASSDSIAEIALSQVGNVGGEIYQKWYGFDFWVDWCAIFASWCADQCGYIDSGVCPKFAGVNSEGIPWFQSRGLWKDRAYVPKIGDYIFIDWELDGEADHVEIVVDVVGYTVHTVGGNRGGGEGECITDTFYVGSNYIYGYGTPRYSSKE